MSWWILKMCMTLEQSIHTIFFLKWTLVLLLLYFFLFFSQFFCFVVLSNVTGDRVRRWRLKWNQHMQNSTADNREYLAVVYLIYIHIIHVQLVVWTSPSRRYSTSTVFILATSSVSFTSVNHYMFVPSSSSWQKQQQQQIVHLHIFE